MRPYGIVIVALLLFSAGLSDVWAAGPPGGGDGLSVSVGGGWRHVSLEGVAAGGGTAAFSLDWASSRIVVGADAAVLVGAGPFSGLTDVGAHIGYSIPAGRLSIVPGLYFGALLGKGFSGAATALGGRVWYPVSGRIGVFLEGRYQYTLRTVVDRDLSQRCVVLGAGVRIDLVSEK